MNSINKVILRGRISEPKFISTQLSLAMRVVLSTESVQKNLRGDWVSEVQHHNVVAFQTEVNIDLETLCKGQLIEIEGMLKYVYYTSAEGYEKVIAEIRADKVKHIE
jgi:single-stranded DNA-binding protein